MTVDDDTSDYKLERYQPIEANPRKEAKRRSGGVAFIIEVTSTIPHSNLSATSSAQLIK